ncbi:MAG: DUF4271 domain-containing protein [Bacteroidales bacterium]|nr:DUF4271 domain-containing protein [Bacteroidales bacterium]
MTTTDTLNLAHLPFYQWDSIPYDLEADAPNMGVAVDTAYSAYLLADSPVEHDSVVRQSMFTGHELVRDTGSLAPRFNDAAPAWVFVVLVAFVALATFYYRQRKIRFGELLQSLFDSRAMDRMLRNNNLTRSAQLAPMGILLAITLALPVHQMALAGTGFVGYLILAVALVLAYFLRNGVIRLLAAVFDNSEAAGLYIASNYLYHFTLATATLPLLLLFFYMPFGKSVVLYMVAALVIIEFLIRLFRGLKLFLTQSRNSQFYLFYYLCIVEIVPILLLIKWLIE